MHGYKALSQDMKAVKGNGMEYELDVKYVYPYEINLWDKGYHFADNIINALASYNNILSPRVFFIQSGEKILSGDARRQFCADEIKLIREVPKEDIFKYIEHHESDIEESTRYRKAVANFGYKLEKYIEDEDFSIRATVAKHSYGLDKLVKDDSWVVRQAIARIGKCLDILVNDEDEDVRKVVASQGYGLEDLIKDDSWVVREAVANYGFGVDKLIHDPFWKVREAAVLYINKNRK